MEQTHGKTKPVSAEKHLEPKAVWLHLTPQQQATVRRTIELVCQDLAHQLTKTEATHDAS